MPLHIDTILIHGGLIALLASLLLLGGLGLNPRLFLKHFPEKVRQAQPALSGREKASGYVLAALLFGLLVGGPVASTLIIASGRGVPHDPVSLWVHAFLVGMVFNLVDWLVLDELILGLGKPRWALPAGVSIADVAPFEHGRHFVGFLKGVLFCACVAALASGLAMSAAILGWFDGSPM